jgi:hypothetical protein
MVGLKVVKKGLSVQFSLVLMSTISSFKTNLKWNARNGTRLHKSRTSSLPEDTTKW